MICPDPVLWPRILYYYVVVTYILAMALCTRNAHIYSYDVTIGVGSKLSEPPYIIARVRTTSIRCRSVDYRLGYPVMYSAIARCNSAIARCRCSYRVVCTNHHAMYHSCRAICHSNRAMCHSDRKMRVIHRAM